MITEIREKAFAKLNICLDITGKMDDGYHSVKSIMQSVTLGDQITIIPKNSGGYFAKSNIKYLPTGEKNIAVRACRLFKQETGEGPDNAFIRIEKRIPVCGGLGGGSTDGAAVLRALNREYRVGLTRTELEDMGAKLGSDVPFCVAGGTVLAEGRGDVLTRIDPMPNCPVVICKPEFSSSTSELFAAIDKLKLRARPDTEGILAAISAGNLKEIARRMFNVFEYALANNRSLMVSELKSRLLDLGALGAAMSGTGSAVYGLFCAAETAKKAAMTLKNEGNVSIYTHTTNEIEI